MYKFFTLKRPEHSLLNLRKFRYFPISIQLILVVLLFVLTAVIAHTEAKEFGHVFMYYPIGVTVLFAPIYEEVIFRGWILQYFSKLYSAKLGLIISSLLFGIWHVKNIFWMPEQALLSQILYAGLIIGPVLAFITLKAKSIWPGVLIHYANNIAAVSLYYLLQGYLL